MPKGPGKGNTNNPNGKPKGIKSKRIQQWEQLGDFITSRGAERAMNILSNLDDTDFLDQYNKLLSYFKPKLSSAHIEANVKQHEPIKIKIITKDAGDANK